MRQLYAFGNLYEAMEMTQQYPICGFSIELKIKIQDRKILKKIKFLLMEKECSKWTAMLGLISEGLSPLSFLL